MTSVIPIDDQSRVAEVRRVAMALAQDEGLSEAAIANAGLAVTEMATNLLKHAQGGEIHVTRFGRHGSNGLDILSIDRGPGIANIEQCLRDGYSSAGTPGTGLGALARRSRLFDTYSETGKGTVMFARIDDGLSPEPPRNGTLVVGFAGRPVSGEQLSGDAWAIREHGALSQILVADGLGHGIQAAEASEEATAIFRASAEPAPAALLRRIHTALRGTRGAAAAIASIDRASRRVTYCGVGNIAGVVVGQNRAQHMVSHSGTIGHEARHFQEFAYPFPEASILIMHSDGLTTSWSLDSYRDLKNHHPSVIGATLYRDATRQRDDVCVVVAKDQTL